MRRLSSVLAISALVLLAACGSSSSKSSSADNTASSSTTSATSDTLSKSAYVSQANSLCKDMGSAMSTAGTDVKAANDAKDVKALSDALSKVTTHLADIRGKVAALKPPADGQSVKQDFLSVLDQITTQFQTQKTKLDQGDSAGVQQAADDYAAAQKDMEAAGKRLDSYGITC